MTKIWWFAGIAGGIILFYVIWTFNRLVGLKTRARAAWSDIEVQLKLRWDLVPRLVSTVEGYTKHEAETLQKVVGARKLAMQGAEVESVEARGQEELSLTEAARSVFLLAEDYPDLKANTNFLDLQKSLVDIEDNLQYARRYYNAVVRDYNILIASFPAMFVASVFRFGRKEFFQIDADERETPGIKI
jgi:LemA protein